MLDKVKTFYENHKNVIVKAGMVVGGAVLGVIVVMAVAVLATETETEILPENQENAEIKEYTSTDENGNMVYNPFEDPGALG